MKYTRFNLAAEENSNLYKYSQVPNNRGSRNRGSEKFPNFNKQGGFQNKRGGRKLINDFK